MQVFVSFFCEGEQSIFDIKPEKMKTPIMIPNALLSIGDVRLNASNHIAEAKGTDIIIVNIAATSRKVFMSALSQVTLNGASYATTAAFVTAFNALSLSSPERRSLDNMKINTDYPDTLISNKITVGEAKAQVAPFVKAGYVEIETDDDNSGTVYIGGTDVSAADANMAPGKKRYFELSDLSKIYVLGSAAGQIVNVTGAYKN